MSGAPKIVLFDLETLPNLPAALEVWPALSQYPGATLRASVSSIICAGWKILGSAETHCECAWDFPEWLVNVNNDRLVCEKIAAVLRDADCVVTHNGKRFDWKFLQTRLRLHGLDPLPRIHHVDTCAEAKRHMYVVNNRLQTVARFLTDEEKEHHEGWDLWVKVHGRDSEAQERMRSYCKQDVVTLEAVFRELRPLITSLPNYNLFNPMRENCCPNCGSTRLKAERKAHTATRSFPRYICLDCRHWSRTDLADQLPR